MTTLSTALKRSVQAVVAFALTIAAVAAQETELQFVDGLRQRGYYDTAIEYLDLLESRADLSPDIREILDLERGITLQQRGAASRIPEDRDLYLSQAETALTTFLNEHPQHPKAAFANATLGELLFDRARTLTWQADSESDPAERATLQARARALIDQAESIYSTARDQYKAQFEQYPTFVDETRDEELFAEKRAAEIRYLRAWYNLNRCMYERGLTWDKGTDQRRDTLIRAAELFDEIYSAYRTVPIGMLSRLMMGRCYQQHDDIGRALGLYQEYLDNRSSAPIAREVRSVAQHYRLICLNHPDRANHELVLQEASEWLQENRGELTTQTGLGILWEKAVAEEKLAAERTANPNERQVLLRQALEDSRLVARYPGAFREPANALNRRVKAALGDQDREPRDFETAFERARGMIDQIQELKEALDAASTEDERRKQSTALTLHLNEVGRLLRLALNLRETDTDPKAAAQAKYLLSYVFFRQRKNFDAIIMARHCMVHDQSADPDTALNATEIAISAAVQAWNDAPAGERRFETLLLRDVCQQIIDLYPQSTRGNEARIRLGRVYQQLGDPLEAARWFLAVPEADPQFASARISAGQAYWTAWTTEAAGREDGRAEQHAPEQMQTWKKEARQLLTNGIATIREDIGPEAPPPPEVVAAEVSLASILNLDGEYQEAIRRLTAGDDHSVLQTIRVDDPAQRPDEGIRSASFAGLTLRLLMRAYVGTQQVDAAIATMAELESTGDQDTTAVYTQLGIELQDELRRLKSAGATDRLAEVRQSFERFLEKVYERRNPGDYNSLLWIGETYFGLGQGVEGDDASAAAYYEKAATAYQQILDGSLADGDTRTAIQLRLARCRRAQQQYQNALDLALDILRQNPMALDAQFAAAHTLADWGAAGSPERLLQAIGGIREDDKQVVWGWADMARRLQRTVQNEPSPEFVDRFLDARYQLTRSRLRYAMADGTDGTSQLRNGMAEITIFTQVYRDLDEDWWAKFDRLYQDLQTQLGDVPRPLQRPSTIVAATPPRKDSDDTAAGDSQTTSDDTTPSTETEASDEGGGLLLPILAMCAAAGAAGGFYVLMNRSGPRRRIAGTDGVSPFSQRGGINPDAVAGVGPKSGRTKKTAGTRQASGTRPAKTAPGKTGDASASAGKTDASGGKAAKAPRSPQRPSRSESSGRSESRTRETDATSADPPRRPRSEPRKPKRRPDASDSSDTAD